MSALFCRHVHPSLVQVVPKGCNHLNQRLLGGQGGYAKVIGNLVDEYPHRALERRRVREVDGFTNEVDKWRELCGVGSNTRGGVSTGVVRWGGLMQSSSPLRLRSDSKTPSTVSSTDIFPLSEVSLFKDPKRSNVPGVR
jgi:hypothetical protein